MEIIKENIQTLISNETNRAISRCVERDCANTPNEKMITDFVNRNTCYHVDFTRRCEDDMDGFRDGNIKNVLNDKPAVEVKVGPKSCGRPRKTELEKLMTRIMVLVSKHIQGEEESVMKKLVNKFSELGTSRIPDPSIIINAKSNPTDRDKQRFVVGESHIQSGHDVEETPDHYTKLSQPDSEITDALIKVAGGVSVENAEEIQRMLNDIPPDDDTIEIDVETIMINGSRYYIDRNTDDLYDFDTDNHIGRFDKKLGRIERVV